MVELNGASKCIDRLTVWINLERLVGQKRPSRLGERCNERALSAARTPADNDHGVIHEHTTSVENQRVRSGLDCTLRDLPEDAVHEDTALPCVECPGPVYRQAVEQLTIRSLLIDDDVGRAPHATLLAPGRFRAHWFQQSAEFTDGNRGRTAQAKLETKGAVYGCTRRPDRVVTQQINLRSFPHPSYRTTAR